MASDLRQIMEALVKLRGGDRRAVMRRLSQEDRRMLDAHRALAAKTPEPTARSERSRKLEAPPCSSWLAKRIAQTLDETDGAALATERTRDALRVVIVERQERQAR